MVEHRHRSYCSESARRVCEWNEGEGERGGKEEEEEEEEEEEGWGKD